VGAHRGQGGRSEQAGVAGRLVADRCLVHGMLLEHRLNDDKRAARLWRACQPWTGVL
jgi:hypothetical protein